MLGIDHIERCNKRNQWPGSMRDLQKQTLSRLSDAAANNHTHTYAGGSMWNDYGCGSWLLSKQFFNFSKSETI